MAEQWDKQAERKNKAIANYAFNMQEIPKEQRAAYLQTAAPQLLANGWTHEEIAGLDLSDTGVNNMISYVISPEERIKMQKLDRHMQMDGTSFATDYMGRIVGTNSERPSSRMAAMSQETGLRCPRHG